MKTFQQFQQDLQEAIPLALPAAGLALPMIGGAVKLAQGYLQARKQGEGRRSQPVDYGQGGETTPRTANVQRPSPKLTAAELQRRQAAADRRAEAQARARETGATGQGELGQKAQQVLDQQRQLAKDAEYAKQRRENPELLKKEAQARTREQRRADQRARMNAAANRLGLPEQMTAPKLMDKHILDTRTTKEKQKEIKVEADLLPYNPAIGDRYKTR